MVTLWSLYNTVDKIQIDDLRTEQVRIVLLSIPTVRMKDWMICKNGELHWQNLLQAPEFFEDVRVLKGETSNISKNDYEVAKPSSGNTSKSSPSAPSRRPLFEDIDLESEETLSLMDSAPHPEVKERRSARRYRKTLLLKVKLDKGVFETKTLDVSMSGIAVEVPLPNTVNENFLALLEYQGHQLKADLSMVSNDKTRTKLTINRVDQWDVLKSWVSGW